MHTGPRREPGDGAVRVVAAVVDAIDMVCRTDSQGLDTQSVQQSPASIHHAFRVPDRLRAYLPDPPATEEPIRLLLRHMEQENFGSAPGAAEHPEIVVAGLEVEGPDVLLQMPDTRQPPSAACAPESPRPCERNRALAGRRAPGIRGASPQPHDRRHRIRHNAAHVQETMEAERCGRDTTVWSSRWRKAGNAFPRAGRSPKWQGSRSIPRDRVYVFCRGEHPLIVFDKDGKFLDAWGEGMFPRPHGIFIDREDRVHLVDCGDHTIRTFTTDGTLLRTVGEPGRCSDTGFVPDVSPVQYPGEPFNQVTNVAVLGDGSMYVADGYGNARVHRFDANGNLEFSWGEPGSAPGQFNLPHGIAVDSTGTVYVADRENFRIQLFSPDGEFRTTWDFVNRPDDIFIDAQDNVHVAELGFRSGVQPEPHLRFMTTPPHGHDPIARVGIYDPDGAVQCRIGGGEEVLPGNFIAPHGLWTDSRGDLYVGEVTVSSGATARLAPFTAQCFQKFVRSG